MKARDNRPLAHSVMESVVDIVPAEKMSEDGAPPTSAAVLAEIERALRGLQFGQITITAQDGVVVQIERIERVRLRNKRG